MKMREVPFVQNFDYIVKKSRLVLDFEKEKYPNSETVDLFLNGTTGELSANLEDVIRKDVPYQIVNYSVCSSKKTAYNIEYVPEEDFVVFHLLLMKPLKAMSQGSKFIWEEFTRFILTKNWSFFVKPNGCVMNERKRYYNELSSYKRSLTEDGEYQRSSKPFLTSHFNEKIQRYINKDNGENYGFMSEIANVMPPVFNATGNDYYAVDSYEKLVDFLEGEKSTSCLKKSGKKQDAIDALTSISLPEVTIKHEDVSSEKIEDGIYKFAVIQKLPTSDKFDTTCVIRTFNYFYNARYLFEGGRIYVEGKSNIYSCKKNNQGDYVNQALLSKVKHWDFDIATFPEDITAGTRLEFFGQIIQKIAPINRSVAIWIFLKEPLMESIVKISSIEFLEEFIDLLRDDFSIDSVLHRTFSLSTKETGKKVKLLQLMGLNKYQFGEIKDILHECMPKEYFISDTLCMSWGIIPIIKALITNNYESDISSIDNKTFDEYLSFATDLFTAEEVAKSFRKEAFFECVDRIISLIKSIRKIFVGFDIRQNFDVFLELYIDAVKRDSYRRFANFGQFSDYLNIIERLMTTDAEFREKEDLNMYKPKFHNIEDMVKMHQHP